MDVREAFEDWCDPNIGIVENTVEWHAFKARMN